MVSFSEHAPYPHGLRDSHLKTAHGPADMASVNHAPVYRDVGKCVRNSHLVTLIHLFPASSVMIRLAVKDPSDVSSLSGWVLPYPPHYKTAFASSGISCPPTPQLPLRFACPEGG
jgi:hypothetical protein